MSPVWITVGIDHSRKTVVLIGISQHKWKAQAAGIERKTEAEYDEWEVFVVDNKLGSKLQKWFVDSGIELADANRTIREFGRCVSEMLENKTWKKHENQEPS